MRLLFPLGRLFVLCLLCAALAACSARQAPVDPAEAGSVWQAMTAGSYSEPAPYRDSLSFRFGSEGNTRRVTALIWGNGADSLRLDVQAGVGVTVGMLSQNGENFLLYAPMEEKAWFHVGRTSPLLRMGLPLPLDLFGLEALLHGRWQEVFGSSWTAVSAAKDGIEFELEGGMGGRLAVSAEGLPVRWSDQNWTILFQMDENRLPRRLDLASVKGEKGVVLIRQREHPEPFDSDQMRLELPEGTVVQPLKPAAR